MRALPLLFVGIFLVFFVLISLGSYFTTRKIAHHTYKRFLGIFFTVWSVLMVSGFLFLYLYPDRPDHALAYRLYFLFNFLFITSFVFHLLMTLSWLIFRIPGKPVKLQPVLYAGFILGFAVAMHMVYGYLAGRAEMAVREVDVVFPDLPAGFDGYKVVQVSDTHLGSMEKWQGIIRRAGQKVKEISPDLVLFTGDLVNNFAEETSGWSAWFRELTIQDNSFSILGNHDYGDYSHWETPEKKEENLQRIVDSHKDLGFKLLRNEHVVIRSGRDSLFLIGVENWGHPPFPQYARLDDALSGIPEQGFKILLSHDPAHWESVISGKENIQLTLSGHSHGFQWGIKPAGITFSTAVLSRHFWGGLYSNGRNYLYVNTGLGTVGFPWRLDMPAEITVFTLQRGEVK